MSERQTKDSEAYNAFQEAKKLDISVATAGMALTATEVSLEINTESVEKFNTKYEAILNQRISLGTLEAFSVDEEGSVKHETPSDIDSCLGKRGKFVGFEIFDKAILYENREDLMNSGIQRLEICLVLIPPEERINDSRHAEVEVKTYIPISKIDGPIGLSR